MWEMYIGKTMFENRPPFLIQRCAYKGIKEDTKQLKGIWRIWEGKEFFPLPLSWNNNDIVISFAQEHS